MIDEIEIERAAAILRRGGLVALPTETVYGLAAAAADDRAVARIFEAKGRPRFNPLIVHVADLEVARALAAFGPLATRLAEAFWPGPLSLVLPRVNDAPASRLVSAGLDTIALRAPAHPAARAVIAAAGPVAAPSANASGAISPTTADHVREGLGDKIDMILDGGRCGVGLESAIVKVEGDAARLLRPGGLDRSAIEAVVGAPLLSPAGGVEAPGMTRSHYAPRARLRLNAEAPQTDEAYLGFGAHAADGPYALNLSRSGDLLEAAANLFAHLHRLDALCIEYGLIGVATAPIPRAGLGEAINDRLTRAASPRSAD